MLPFRRNKIPSSPEGLQPMFRGGATELPDASEGTWGEAGAQVHATRVERNCFLFVFCSRSWTLAGEKSNWAGWSASRGSIQRSSGSLFLREDPVVPCGAPPHT